MKSHMRTVKTVCLAAGLALLMGGRGAIAATETAAEDAEASRIQMAILLDTSGSMSGLIDQARSQIWTFVNEFALAQKNGVRPVLEVALFEYGKDALPAKEGYVREICPLTTDLDRVSEELFALKTNGGSEYCGWVIRDATERLAWSDSGADYKVIFIAGNEGFDQGPVAYKEACAAAIERGILVNTIYCGQERHRDAERWREGALLADGRSLTIDHNAAVAHVEAPQDEEIARLGGELNKTYVAYGDKGGVSAQRQEVQDANASSVAPAVAVQRAVSKASVHYRNAAWDLVDAVKEGQVDLAEVATEDLPESMQSMTPEEREAHVRTMRERRATIQARIQTLNEERRAYVAEKQREQAAAQGRETLDTAVLSAVREQAVAAKFQFE